VKNHIRSERHHALEVAYSADEIKRSDPPTPLVWKLNDFIVALVAVGAFAAFFAGVL
jgi:hypothetical protein